MTWYEVGAGPTVLFLHGCYDSALYRPLVDLFTDRHRCVIHDQRGAQQSPVDRADPDALDVHRYIADMERLRHDLAIDRCSIIAHSSGTVLALMYALAHPQRIDKLVLIGLGPLSDDMRDVYRANTQRIIEAVDDVTWDTADGAYRHALRTGQPLSQRLDATHIRIWSRVMTYGRDAAERFARDYLAEGGIARRPPNWTGFDGQSILDRAGAITVPVLLLHGHQDYEPLAQVYELAGRLPNARIVLLNRCGHLTWLDQPEGTRAAIEPFLAGGQAAEAGA
jgi:pimeloyl-ACP methyl ester carboxylesterase